MAKLEVQKQDGPSTPAPQYSPLSLLHDDIDRAFDRIMRTWPSRSMFDLDPFKGVSARLKAVELQPSVDVSESDKSYEISVELPGVEEKDVSVTLKDDMLTFKGEKKSEREEKDKDYHMTERSYGSFERSFRLPEDVEADKIEARFANGVMKVTLPKSEKAKAKERKISIKAK